MLKGIQSFCLFVVLMAMGSCGAFHKTSGLFARLPASNAQNLNHALLQQHLHQLYLHQVILEKHMRDPSNLKELRIKATSKRKLQLESEFLKQFTQSQSLQDELTLFSLKSGIHARALKSLHPETQESPKNADLDQVLVSLSQQREFQVAEKNIEHLAYMLE